MPLSVCREITAIKSGGLRLVATHLRGTFRGLHPG